MWRARSPPSCWATTRDRSCHPSIRRSGRARRRRVSPTFRLLVSTRTGTSSTRCKDPSRRERMPFRHCRRSVLARARQGKTVRFEVTSGSGRYRGIAEPIAGSRDVAVVISPLRDVEATLTRLYWIEGIATGDALDPCRCVGAVAHAGRAASARPHRRHRRCRGVGRRRPSCRYQRRLRSRALGPRVERRVRRAGRIRTDAALRSSPMRRTSSERLSRRFVAMPNFFAPGRYRRGRDSPRHGAHRARGGPYGGPRRQPPVFGATRRRPSAELADVDLTALAADAVADARAVEPDRPITLVARAPVHVMGDETTLATGAREPPVERSRSTPHLQRRSRCGSALTAESARLEVVDDGRRPRASARDRVFDRFWRGSDRHRTSQERQWPRPRDRRRGCRMPMAGRRR